MVFYLLLGQGLAAHPGARLLPQACNSNAHPLETSEMSPTGLVIPFLHVYNGANRSIPNVSGCSED